VTSRPSMPKVTELVSGSAASRSMSIFARGLPHLLGARHASGARHRRLAAHTTSEKPPPYRRWPARPPVASSPGSPALNSIMSLERTVA